MSFELHYLYHCLLKDWVFLFFSVVTVVSQDIEKEYLMKVQTIGVISCAGYGTPDPGGNLLSTATPPTSFVVCVVNGCCYGA